MYGIDKFVRGKSLHAIQPQRISISAGMSASSVIAVRLPSPLIRVVASHTNNRKFQVDLPGVFGDFPARHLPSQIDVGHKGAYLSESSPTERPQDASGMA
jgi:hypothetical protein